MVRVKTDPAELLLWRRLQDEPIPDRWRGVGGFSTFYQDTGGLAHGRQILLGQDPDYYDNFMSRHFRKTATDGTRQTFVVDDEDADLVRDHRWSIVAIQRSYGVVYAVREASGAERLYLHQLIIGPPPEPDLVIDHRDRDKLNNRRSNLRWATRSQNKVNSGKLYTCSPRWTPFKGVSWDPTRRVFLGQIRQRSKKLRRVSTFPTPEEAAHWYDVQAVELFGEFACTNAMLGLFHTTDTHNELAAAIDRPTDSLSVGDRHLAKESHVQ